MTLSIFDMFSIGIGPSSSHTVGPMKAANQFVQYISAHCDLQKLHAIKVELFGSLGHTGKGHGSDKAVILGLLGEHPETVDTDQVGSIIDEVIQKQSLPIHPNQSIYFDYDEHIIFNRKESLPKHPNGMRFSFLSHEGKAIAKKDYYSVGGGFIVKDDENPVLFASDTTQPYPFASGDELLSISKKTGLSIATIMLENEKTWQETSVIKEKILHLWHTMDQSIDKGCQVEGILPGGLKVKRRAPGIYRKLKSDSRSNDSMLLMDWVDLYALAVNEENAAGGRVVTAPTNGAAGILPAVIKYHQTFTPGAAEDDVVRFILTAGAIGMLYKMNASISGAEVGCQGEIGVACSMAAAGLTEVMGGTSEQIENAAEIGMEHNLGLTCDPVGGLVQVPCIERNAMGAVKAINAARLALRGDGNHKVSLDKVIKTMRQTGADMQSKYKETARGGLAVNIIEC